MRRHARAFSLIDRCADSAINATAFDAVMVMQLDYALLVADRLQWNGSPKKLALHDPRDRVVGYRRDSVEELKGPFADRPILEDSFIKQRKWNDSIGNKLVDPVGTKNPSRPL